MAGYYQEFRSRLTADGFAFFRTTRMCWLMGEENVYVYVTSFEPQLRGCN